MFELPALLAIAGTFLLAGTVKGVIGLGLPTVSLALLTVALDLPSAMALLLVPSFVTNLWQSLVGGNAKAIVLRIWPFLVMATGTVWIGAAYMGWRLVRFHAAHHFLTSRTFCQVAADFIGLLRRQLSHPVLRHQPFHFVAGDAAEVELFWPRLLAQQSPSDGDREESDEGCSRSFCGHKAATMPPMPRGILR